MTPSPARFWHWREDGILVCDLCPHACMLREGQRGRCSGRLATAEGLVATTYGSYSALAVDPIEKKPLYHFLPGTGVLSLGTTGCNLTCSFCQNWGISRAAPGSALRGQADPAQIALLARARGCQSVAFTYNEPIVWAEYALDIAQACREIGLRTVAVTNGFVSSQAGELFFDAMDAANVDLKAFDQSFYQRLCGARLEPVIETLRSIRARGRTWLEITTLIIPGINDDLAQVDRLTSFILKELGPEVPLHFSAFHPDHEMLNLSRTPVATLQRCREQGLSKGLQHVYVGNVRDPSGSTTFCSSCKTELIQRSGFAIERNQLLGGCCARCGRPLAGVFQTEAVTSTPG